VPEKLGFMQEMFADGNFSIEQASKLHDDGFFEKDVKSFELDREKFASVLHVTGVKTFAPDAYFDYFDVDKNGVIDWVEFCSGVSFVMRDMGTEEENKQYVAFLYYVLDADHSGTLEVIELQTHLKKQAVMFYPLPEEKIESIIAESLGDLDKEDTDVVDYADFEAVLAVFDKALRSATLPDLSVDMPVS
jgi:Ca2+-binding EF-hand superfamily protein